MYIAQLKELLEERKEEIKELKENLKNKKDEENKSWEIIKNLNFWSVIIPFIIGVFIGYFIDSLCCGKKKIINISSKTYQISEEKKILKQINKKLENIEKNNKNYFYDLKNNILKIKNIKQKCNDSDCKTVSIINNCK